MAFYVVGPLRSALGRSQPLLQFQLLDTLRNVSFLLCVAVPRILGVLYPQLHQVGSEQANATQLARLQAVTKSTDEELARLMTLELTPIAQDEATVQELHGAMRSWLVRNTIRSGQKVRVAMENSMRRRSAAQATHS